jgi:type IX secretion system PorP/SprF family membrane protein
MKPDTLKLIRKNLPRIILLLIISFKGVIAQDLHFSLFNASPLFINPAHTGNFEGDWRLSGNYRDQWRTLSTPYTTAAVSFDKGFIIQNRKIAAGINFFTDNSGGIGLASNKLYLSGAYFKHLEKHIFIFGLQAGYVFRSYGSGNLTFPSDYNHDDGKFFTGSNKGELKSYPDINAGAIWKSSFTIFEPEAGIAVSHLNNPNESFFDAKEKLPLRFTFHGKVKTKITDELYLRPSVLLMNQLKAREMMLGTDVGIKILKRGSNVKEVFAGVYMRDAYFTHSDAISVVGGITVSRIDIIGGYDFNVSGLKTATGKRGAFEISFIFKSISTVLNSYSIPCERF